jgi:uncharacterized SAM-binding protein YcdF (DUF218 family)
LLLAIILAETRAHRNTAALDAEPLSHRFSKASSSVSSHQQSGSRFRSRKWLIFGIVFLGLVLFLLSAAYFFPQQILCVDSGKVQADVVVVLGGGSDERPTRAAELFRSGAAPRIIVSGAGDWTANERILMAAGVPPTAIELEGKSRSTKQNAQFSIPLLRRLDAERRTHGATGPLRVIVVTTWYHSRRALHAFQHYAPDIQFYSRPAYYAYSRAQWTREGVCSHIRAEYVKLPAYWLCYGICPI